MVEKVLAFDLGGTKLAYAVIDANAKLHDQGRVLVESEKGKDQLFAKIQNFGERAIENYPEITKVSIACAGPNQISEGLILNPTNLKTEGEAWGTLEVKKFLQESFNKEIFFENDAAASILAERWIGHARDCPNAMILTLGTGLGVGVLIEGKLFRSARGMHPEAGHLSLNYSDKEISMGNACPGAAEAYLSGKNFSRNVGRKWGQAELKTQELVQMARDKDSRALEAFEEYAEWMALAIYNYALLFAPELVIFSGGFSHAAEIFIPATKKHLDRLLSHRRGKYDLVPQLKISEFQDEIALYGAAYKAFLSKDL